MPAPDLSERALGDLVSLSGRVAVVTGGAREMGSRPPAALPRPVHGSSSPISTCAGPRRRHASSTDERSRWTCATSAALERLADDAVSALGRLDVWVNNAGVYPTHEALDMEPDDWDRVLDIDLRGVFLGARVAARRMVELESGGVIVNIASTAAYRVAGRGIAHYAAAKHGVLGLTKSLAVEFGSNGIRVLAVAPCVTATPGIEDAGRAMEAAGFAIERLGGELPLGRIAVRDIARVVLFCASDLAALMTGSTLLVDAGWLAT